MTEPFTLKQQLKNYLSNLRSQMTTSATPKVSADPKELANYIMSDQQIEKLAAKAIKFIDASNEMSKLWHSRTLVELRQEETKLQGPSPVYKIKCIDGRKPRGYEGEAHSLKSEKGQLALSLNSSTGQLIPLGADVCVNLSHSYEEPLEMSFAHYDSTDSQHGCAAMGLVIKDFVNNISGTWKFLSAEGISLVQKAAERSQEYANLVLLELTNRVALENIHNDYRILQKIKPLQRIAVTALFDTRTMGFELWTPLLVTGNNHSTLPSESEIKKLSTTVLLQKFSSKIAKVEEMPKMGLFEKTFTQHEFFTDYSKKIVEVCRLLMNPKTPVGGNSNNLFQEITDFVSQNYGDLTQNQQQALIYRIIRTIAHQYLTALYLAPKKHLYADHGEKFIAIAEDGNYPGKYLIEYQCFRMSGPDPATSARRLEISALVMDNIGVDATEPHIAFFSTSIGKYDYEHRDDPIHNEAYNDARRSSIKFYKGLLENPGFRSLVESKNTIPIPVLTIRETGEVVKIFSSNALYY